MTSANLLVRKLEAFQTLSQDDKRLIEAHTSRTRVVEAKQDIISEGDAPDNVHLILSGFACRYKIVESGTRQIVAYLVPGDFCDLHVFILKAMDHSIGTLSRCRVVDIPRQAILDMTDRPLLGRALWWATLVDEAVLREWIVNMGARPAEERVAHLLCELLLRLDIVGLVQGGSYELPITQSDLADTMGLSVVHVNRMLQNLREQGLITLKSKTLVVKDAGRLMQISGFDPNYLHLGGGRPDDQPKRAFS